MTTNSSLKSYVLFFSCLYIGLVIGLVVVLTFMDWDIGTSGNIGILMGSLAALSTRFATKEKRPPTRKENLKITTSNYVMIILISGLIMTGLSLFMDYNMFEMFKEVSINILIFSVLFVSVIYYSIMYFTFGGMTKIFVKQLEKEQNKKP